jgi:hypothetical protein
MTAFLMILKIIFKMESKKLGQITTFWSVEIFSTTNFP